MARLRESEDLQAAMHRLIVEDVEASIGMEIDERDRAAELSILREYYQNAYRFARQEMCFSDDKAAAVMNVARAMIDYEYFKPADLQRLAAKVDQQELSKTIFDKMRRKLESLQDCFSVQEIMQISEHYVHSYISNIRLWLHALSNKQQSETAICFLFIDEPMPSPPLSRAVARLQLPKEEIAFELGKKNRISSRQTTKRGVAYEQKPQETVRETKDEVETMEMKIERNTADILRVADEREAMLAKALDERLKKK